MFAESWCLLMQQIEIHQSQLTAVQSCCCFDIDSVVWDAVKCIIVLFSFSVSTVQAKRDDYCQNRYGSTPKAGCGTTLRAMFDSKDTQVGKIWRCFYDVALTIDSHSKLYVYDTVKNSPCLHSISGDLLAINDWRNTAILDIITITEFRQSHWSVAIVDERIG